jgi:oligopeptide transport system ATP-binding protein
MRRVRGSKIAIVLDDPLTSLNPAFRVGDQIMEAVSLHSRVSRAAARERTVELLRRVGIPSPAERAEQYPKSYSGGMRQRAVIAMALAGDPELLIADEPTTALDVTIQAQVLNLIQELCQRDGTSVLLITNNLGVAGEIADRTAVMYAGKIVEEAASESLGERPHHPYTQGLFASSPDMNLGNARLTVIPGRPPDPLEIRKGSCAFSPRCSRVMQKCRTLEPPPYVVGAGHESRCFLAAEGTGAGTEVARE